MYKAHRLGATVAVKALKSEADASSLNQLYKESFILERVSHNPNVVQFYGTCECSPPMLCMEYMEVRSALPIIQLRLGAFTIYGITLIPEDPNKMVAPYDESYSTRIACS